MQPSLPTSRSSRRAFLAAGAAVGVAAATVRTPVTAHADDRTVPEPIKVPEAIGRGGAVASVDPYASDIGVRVLRAGGNAVDAAVATAAALGVTEPFSSGIGGGGFFVYRDARSGRVWTINGRENAPRTFTEDVFTDGDGNALAFGDVVTSGLSIGVPGTLATWATAARWFGTRRLGDLLEPAEELARRGFVVDAHFQEYIESNADRFAKFPASAALFLPGGAVPSIGDGFRNPDLADTYRLLRRRGTGEFYDGPIGRAVAEAAGRPPTAPGVDVYAGQLTMGDIRRYRAEVKPPTRSGLRDRTVYGMSLPSSGGIAVGEILNLIQAYQASTGISLAQLSEVDYLHRFSEASATAFADRNRWVGDVPGVPIRELLSTRFARERAGLFDPEHAQPRPIPFGFPRGGHHSGHRVGQPEPYEGPNTTHLNVVDRWGNAVAYTLTIEQIGGSGITVPGYGFLLNNELTDFDFVPLTAGVPDPNLPGPGKQPRSSMSPTIITRHGRPELVCGTPGGATIITSVAQIILGHLERGLPLVDAIKAPRLSSRNSSTEATDQGLADSATGAGLTALGHKLVDGPEIGNASGIDVGRRELTAAAETDRAHGGSARVVRPQRP
ncbi:gamma-glutamyltransferase [Microlunatus elymi]|uniref:Glutathione hydrolase proenzyme n=1 Tax=Microlunatus elymi TaxID=2596828 RepID=A0A516Q156_9ACTN|nr:gamma-glutamyltransferase [Microlunatus elymi]QDP97170.1 gamma-glutamyltransferase [Microlunatus elymi]